MFSTLLKINRGALLIMGILIFVSTFLSQNKAYAYGECSAYGMWATYDYVSGDCKCISGYVFGKDILGQTTCVSGDIVCHDKYGYSSRYNYLNGSCECSYDYIFGKDSIGRTRCVSPSSICTDQLGYSARYNSLSDKCECGFGYVISDGRCTDGDTVCHSKHGVYSSYNDSDTSCECDSGYTFDNSNQCVKKQNNVYFTVKELDTEERKAIIKSDYGYMYYLISYNSGCYASSFRRYLNDQIVVNLGTDFDLDAWDKIVLQDDNEVCDITRVERADSSTSLQPEEENTFYYDPSLPIITTPTYQAPPTPIVKAKEEFWFDETKKKDFDVAISAESKTTGALRQCPSTSECGVIKYIDSKTKLDILGSYNNEEWYRVTTINDPKLSGWMHSSIVKKEIKSQKATQKESEITSGVANIQDKPPETSPWYRRIFYFFFNILK